MVNWLYHETLLFSLSHDWLMYSLLFFFVLFLCHRWWASWTNVSSALLLHIIHTEILCTVSWSVFTFRSLNCFLFAGKLIQQTTTRTKTSARGIQNKQFTQVRHCCKGWGLKIEVTVRIIQSHAFSWFSLSRWLNCIFLTTWRYQRWIELWAVVNKAYLVSFYEKQYQHNTGDKKNIMAVISMPYSVLHGDFRMMNNDLWLKPPQRCTHF